MPKLTKTIIDNTPFDPDRDIWIWDTELPGFGLRIQSSGRKTYVARYRTADHTQRKQTIARCSDMPPDRARDQARKVFALAAEGKDPMEQKRAKVDTITLEDLRDRYMKEHATPFKKAHSVDNDKGNWRRHLIPYFKGRKVASITRSDVLALVGSLAERPATANQVLALLSKAMSLADEWGMRPGLANPCARVKKFRINERELILSPDQIIALNTTLTDLVESDEIPRAMANLVRLLMITGCRLNEIMSARREWVDVERRLLLLPDSKVGQRRIPLSQAAMDIIATVHEGKWLIPGRVHGQHLQTPYKLWKLIKQRAGLPMELRHHDLRHTAGSLGHMAGLTQKQIATMLGHKQLSTTERYLHGFVGDNAKSADTISSVITAGWTK